MRTCANIVCMGYLSVADLDGASVTVSIVSHGQAVLVQPLLRDLSRCPQVARIVLTYNIPEEEVHCPESLNLQVQHIRNGRPLGFGANHNKAFKLCETEFFAVLNPDIRLISDPFAQLVGALKADPAGVIAPVVLDPDGEVEDSARRFPTPMSLLRKLVGLDDGRIVSRNNFPQDVDWVAGMFLLFPKHQFIKCGGFDERFHLYYEDVDICTRLWRSGRRVILDPRVSVIHAAQRASRRNLRHLVWHISSMFRYFSTYLWRLPR
jgi:N-acetylglucosaminyl-diphospho-decaprenol L-rhamnosyltransferase